MNVFVAKCKLSGPAGFIGSRVKCTKLIMETHRYYPAVPLLLAFISLNPMQI